MFFLKLEGDDLERLLKLAAEKKGTPVERLARLAFLNGLRLLAKADSDIEIDAKVQVIRGRRRRKSLEEVQAYIREHWEQETDAQMGEALGYGWGRIRSARLEMGLLREKGKSNTTRPSPPSPRKQRRERLNALIREHWGTKDDAEIGRLMSPVASLATVRQHRLALGLKKKGAGSPHQEHLDALIREHWETKDDAEIGRLMSPPLSRPSVFNRRCELGLKKVQGSTARKAVGEVVRVVVEPAEFERMVLREGYTMTEYLQHKDLKCTRERLRQIAEELGLKHSPRDRAPEWALIRLARKLGNINLANREWLGERVAAATSMVALASELRIQERDLFIFIRGFKFTHPSFRKHGAETVNLVCAKCGTKFTRLKKSVDWRKKQANGHALDFYCSALCAGKYDRIAARERRKKEKSPARLRLQQLKQEKIEREAAFIRDNWQSMSDTELADALGCSLYSVEDKRLALGFKRV